MSTETIGAEEIAGRFGVTVGHFWRLFHQGRMSRANNVGCAVNGRIRIPEVDFNKLLINRREDA